MSKKRIKPETKHEIIVLLSDICPNLKGSELPGETSPMIVSLFSRFRFVISMYCIFAMQMCNKRTKESFVSRTNAPLVGTLISIDDVSESIAIRRGLFNQGPAATQTFWKKESFYIRKRF